MKAVGSSQARGWRDPRLVGATSGVLTAAFYVLGAGRALDYDSAETVGFFVRTGSLLDAVRTQRAFNNHPLFSLLVNGVVRLTGTTEEAVLRALPIAFGAVTVGLIAAHCARRWGGLAGACAAAVVATNPVFAELSRAVRGYSLMTLAIVVSTMTLQRLLDPKASSRRSAELLYVAASAIAIATHLYALVPLSGHVVLVLARGGLRPAWVRRWAAAIVLGGVAYLAIFGGMVDAMAGRGRRFQPDFPFDLARELLGGTTVSAVLVGVAAMWGAVLVRRATPSSVFRWMTVWLVAAVAVPWLAANTDLAPRFFVWLVPAVAVLVAICVARAPAMAAAVVVAAALSSWSLAPEWAASPHPYPEVAGVIDADADAGLRVCALDLSVPPLLAYTDRFEAVTRPSQLSRCDTLVVVHPALDPDLVAAADAAFGGSRPIGGPGDARIWTRRGTLSGDG
ncbi:MAG: hypothetical protein IPM45_17550 [Acidimicrobiales bacterium]|nr:hypothetical protein [Acidimicrobiales bacterium]